MCWWEYPSPWPSPSAMWFSKTTRRPAWSLSEPSLGVARGPLQERRPLQLQHGYVHKQPMSNPWSTSSQPEFVRALGRRKRARRRQGKIFYTKLLKSWSTLGQLLANSSSHGRLQGSSLQWSSGNTRLAPRQIGSENRRKSHIRVSRDCTRIFGGDSVYVFFSPVGHDPPKTYKQIFATHPVPGQSCKCVESLFMRFFLSQDLEEPKRVPKQTGTKIR